MSNTDYINTLSDWCHSLFVTMTDEILPVIQVDYKIIDGIIYWKFYLEDGSDIEFYFNDGGWYQTIKRMLTPTERDIINILKELYPNGIPIDAKGRV